MAKALLYSPKLPRERFTVSWRGEDCKHTSVLDATGSQAESETPEEPALDPAKGDQPEAVLIHGSLAVVLYN